MYHYKPKLLLILTIKPKLIINGSINGSLSFFRVQR